MKEHFFSYILINVWFIYYDKIWVASIIDECINNWRLLTKHNNKIKVGISTKLIEYNHNNSIKLVGLYSGFSLKIILKCNNYNDKLILS